MKFASFSKQSLVSFLIFSIVTGCGRSSLNDDASNLNSGGDGEGQGFFADDGNGNRMPTGQDLSADPVNFTNGLGNVLVSRPQGNSSALNLIPRLVAVLAGVIAAVRYIFSRRTGTVITRWGNSTAPASLAGIGGELIYAGFGYGAHYTHHGRDPECVVGGDASNEGPDNHADALYVLATGGRPKIPQDIPERKIIPCAKLRVSSVTTVIHGSDKCPLNWAKIYSGYEMGGFYNYAGRGGPICVDPDFNTLISDNNSGSYVYGTALHDQAPNTSYTNGKYLKCAVCAQM